MGIIYKKYLEVENGGKVVVCNACKTHFATCDSIISRVICATGYVSLLLT